MKYVSRSLVDTRNIAKEFLKTLSVESPRHQVSGATVVALYGDLGSGKTNFTQTIGSLFNIKENMQSPTFVIMKIYDIKWKSFENLIHIDAYRIERDEELIHLGWEGIISAPENLVFIEWPENVKNIIPKYAKKVFLKFVDENTREIIYEN